MAAPSGVTWDLLPHTAAKHAILHQYLGAWFPILGIGTARELYYFDGFAGPGEYTKGEVGSPLIALDAASQVASKLPSAVHFVFSELEAPRAQHLSQLLSARRYPPHFQIDVRSAVPFEEVMTEYLGKLELLPAPPSMFVFIDPFGWKGFPMEIVRRILRLPRAEVFVNFMYEEINRFISVNRQSANFDALFGCHDWVEVIDEPHQRMRNEKLWSLYDRQLRSFAGAKYVRSFEMRNDNNAVDYYLFYGTGHLLGLDKMKEAMWKVDPSGRFQFSDATDPAQMTLFGSEPDLPTLKRLLADRFRASRPRYSTVSEFVVAETPFIESHCKRVLREMESTEYPSLQVFGSRPGRRKGDFSDADALLEFIDAPSQLPMTI